MSDNGDHRDEARLDPSGGQNGNQDAEETPLAGPAEIRLVETLAARAPALAALYAEHLDDCGELLTTVYFGSLMPWFVNNYLAWTRGDETSTGWRDVLDVLEAAMGDDRVDTAVSTSFLETLPYHGEDGHDVVLRLGPRLREELLRQWARPREADPELAAERAVLEAADRDTPSQR